MKNKNTFRVLIVLFSMLILNLQLYAQEQSGQDVEELLDFSLESIMDMTVVSASRHEQRIIESPRSIAVITAQEIREKNYRTTPEALTEILGVHIQQTNYGGGSPFLRGLVGNQILIMVDGVRMNNAIYRLGPNQYLNTIDINQIEQIEVVKGAGSVLYGSDALGGLINIITKSKVKKSDDSDASVRAFGRYASADRGSSIRFELGKQLNDLNFFGGASWKNFNNLKGGSNTGLQNFTGYSEWNTDVKVGYSPSGQHSFIAGYQHVTQNNVPRSDVLISKSELQREWEPELRDLAYLDYNFDNVNSFIDHLTAKASYHIQSERIYRITSAKPTVQNQNLDKVNTLESTIQLSSSIAETHLFTYGADFTLDKIKSTRTDLDLKTGTIKNALGNYADGSRYSTLAFFMQDEINLSENWSVNLGARYTSINVDATLQDKATGTVIVDINPRALVGSGYLMYKFNEGFNISFGVSQGFRAPNIDDATKLGYLSDQFQYPNPNLNPEKSLNYELGTKISTSSYSGSMFLFYSDIEDLILYVPGIYNGLSYLDINNNGTKDSNEPSVYTRSNLGKGRIFGFEAESKYQFFSQFEMDAKVAWTKGEDKTTKDPLSRIPPLEGRLGAKWRVSENLWIEYYNLFALKQDRLSPSDKTDKRIPAGGTPGFVTYNLRGAYDLNSFGRITVGLENISNASYKYHGSGIYAPGINLVIGYDIAL